MYKKTLFTAIMLASVAVSGNALAEQNQGYKSRAEALEAVREKLGEAVASNFDEEKLRQLQASPSARKLLERLKKRMDDLSPEQRKQMLNRAKNQSPSLSSPKTKLRKKEAQSDMKNASPLKQKQQRQNQRKGPTLQQVPQGQ